MTYVPVSGGLDSSWQYIINRAFDKHQPFVFTVGPLGFINYPLNIGSNLDIAVLVRVILWLGFMGTVSYLVLRHYVSLRNASIFALLFALGNFGEFDYFVNFSILFLLALILYFDSRYWMWRAVTIIIFSAGLCLMKFSAGVLAIVSCWVFTVCAVWIDKKKAAALALLIGIGLPVLIVTFYWVYDPSWSGLFAYLKSGYEIVSGYNVAMSLPGERRRALMLAAIFFGAYPLLLWKLYRAQRRSFWLAMSHVPALFVAFKHGFVRQDGHVMFFFTFTLALLGLLILFTDLKGLKYGLLPVLIPILIPCLSYDFLLYKPSPNMLHTIVRNVVTLSGRHKLTMMMQTLRYAHTKTNLDAESQRLLLNYRLPQDWLQTIGDAPVGIFPWEAAYIPANTLNFRHFPVIQSYSAYTSYLDTRNAEFLENAEQAPLFLLMEWVSMHKRHPLMDVPATWLALYRWYDVKKWHDHLSPLSYLYAGADASQSSLAPLLLLKRRTTPRFQSERPMTRRDYRSGEYIEVPTSPHPLIMRASLDLTLLGKLAKILFKIPEVQMEFVSDAGYQTFRIVPEMLANGILINALPLNLRDLARLFDQNQSWGTVYALKISGPGAFLYKNTLPLEFCEIADIRVSTTPPSISSSEPPIGSSGLYHIEKVDLRTIATPPGQSRRFVLIQGWAVDDTCNDVANGISVRIDGQDFPAYYGFLRPDVSAFFKTPHYIGSGFQVGIPVERIGPGRHSLSIKIFTNDPQTSCISETTRAFSID